MGIARKLRRRLNFSAEAETSLWKERQHAPAGSSPLAAGASQPGFHFVIALPVKNELAALMGSRRSSGAKMLSRREARGATRGRQTADTRSRSIFALAAAPRSFGSRSAKPT